MPPIMTIAPLNLRDRCPFKAEAPRSMSFRQGNFRHLPADFNGVNIDDATNHRRLFLANLDLMPDRRLRCHYYLFSGFNRQFERVVELFWRGRRS